MRRPITAFILAAMLFGIIVPLVIIGSQRLKPKTVQGIRGIRVQMPGGKVQVLELEEYLVGVVSAEMPAEFGAEALKAQAVAARTYAVGRISRQGAQDQAYDVDTTERTQAWISDAAMRKKWGMLRYLTYKYKVTRVVKETKGLVLTYEGAYVQAFFFSSSGRLPTERAEEVWGGSLPYLTNVKPEADEAARFVVHSAFTAKELDNRLGTSMSKKARLTASDITVIEHTTAGRAKTVRVGGKIIPAIQLRYLLGLKSTDFNVQVNNNRVVFTTYGNGHAVGMSQYGANALAKQGKTFSQILIHYYPGSSILNIDKPKD